MIKSNQSGILGITANNIFSLFVQSQFIERLELSENRQKRQKMMKKILNFTVACKSNDNKGLLFYIKCKYGSIINLEK